MKKRYKRTFLVLYAFCSLLAEGVSAQSLVLSLEKTISLATDSSLEAFRTKNLFLSGYWEFRNYKAERLPSLTLNITRRILPGYHETIRFRKRHRRIP